MCKQVTSPPLLGMTLEVGVALVHALRHGLKTIVSNCWRRRHSTYKPLGAEFPKNSAPGQLLWLYPLWRATFNSNNRALIELECKKACTLKNNYQFKSVGQVLFDGLLNRRLLLFFHSLLLLWLLWFPLRFRYGRGSISKSCSCQCSHIRTSFIQGLGHSCFAALGCDEATSAGFCPRSLHTGTSRDERNLTHWLLILLALEELS